MVESFGPDVKGRYMGLVFWIDENTFATSLIGKALKSQGVDFYTINSADDFAYLISDLKPQIIVIDATTALKTLDVFTRQYLETDKFFGAKVVILGNKSEFTFIDNIKSELARPIDPFSLKDYFSKI